jgi:hypothetical protein
MQLEPRKLLIDGEKIACELALAGTNAIILHGAGKHTIP